MYVYICIYIYTCRYPSIGTYTNTFGMWSGGTGQRGMKVLQNPKQAPMPFSTIPWILPPLSNSWIINMIWLYIVLNRTPNVDCYWVGAVPKLYNSYTRNPGTMILVIIEALNY